MIIDIPPLIIFLVVWLLDGAIIAWFMRLAGMKGLSAVAWAYGIALVPAAIATLYGMQ